MFSSYFCAYCSRSGKYGIIGVIGLLIESPIRYSICVKAGWKPSNISIGIKMGASNPHFADALPISMLIIALKRMTPMMSTTPF